MEQNHINHFGPPDNSLWLQRPLGYWEVELIRDLPVFWQGPKRCTINNVARISVNPGYKINLQNFEDAVKATVYNEPHLRATVDLQNLVWTKATDFSDIFKFNDLRPKGINSLDEMMPLVKEFANQVWDYECGKPLYKCRLFQTQEEYVLMNVYHHGVGDGTSGMLMVGGILKQYNLLENGQSVELAPLAPRPPTDEVTKVESDEEMVRKMLAEFLHRSTNYKPFLPLDSEELEENNQRPLPVNLASFFDGDPQSYISIKEKCKEIGVTIGQLYFAASYLATAAIHAKQTCIDVNEYGGMKDEYLDIPVNLRHRLVPPIGPNYCAFYVHMLTSKVNIGLKTTLWGLAKDIRSQLEMAMDNKEHFLYLKVKKLWETGKHKDIAHSFPSSGIVDVICSNLGPYPFDFKFPWGRITSDYLIGSMISPEASNVFFNLASTDRFHYSLVHSPGKNNQEMSINLFNCFIAIMENSAKVRVDFSLKDVLVDYV